MNIREIAGIDLNYYSLNREERNYAAIFFAALCRPGNITKFLELCECDLPEQVSDDFGIYFEYVYIPVKVATHSGFNLPPFESFLFPPRLSYQSGRFDSTI